MTLTPTTSPLEAAARYFEPRTHTWNTPGDLARHIDPRVRQTPALDLIDQALVTTTNTPDGRLTISMPPQEGKSQRASRWFPLWALTANPDLRIAIVSYELNAARRWGRAIRDEITMHPDLCLRVRDDLSAQHEWQLQGHDGGVYAAGIGGALTGRPVDLLIIDDPVKDREQADSKTYRDRAWDWWTDVGSTRLAPGAPVIVIATRWHEEDLIGRLLTAEDGHLWRELNIPAQADHDPAAGETDPLEREPGEFMVSARGRTRRQWEAIKVRSGARTWASLYQGRPSPAEGDILKREWWQTYTAPVHVERADSTCIVPDCDDLLISWDLTFKDTTASDYVVGQVWMRRGADAYLLDQVRDRMDFPRTLAAVKALARKWPQATLKIIEDKANGPAVIASLAREVPGIVPEEPQGSKVARANAVAPLVEAGNVWLPDPKLAPWVDTLIEEAAGFPNATHDDQVDALSQGLNRLVLQPLIDGEIVEDDDLDPDLADHVISPY